jgi:RND family efflux transporter MFP subunit
MTSPLHKNLDALRIDRSERPPRRAGRYLVLAGLALALVAAALAWRVFGPAAASVVQVAAVRTEAGGPGGGAVLNATGYVTARRRATVSAEITGRVAEVNVEEGLAVEKGHVVARLDDATYRAALDLAGSSLTAAERTVEETRARLALAELTLDRARRLVREGVAQQEELDRASTEVAALRARAGVEEQRVVVAQREVELRRTELAKTVIRAPFAGVVISKDAQPGEMVSPAAAGGGFTRTGLCTIVDMSSLEIEVEVNESYIARVRSGQRVLASLDAYPDWRIPAHVITTIPAADRQKATVLVRAGFDELDPRILPDMGIKVAFLEDRTAEAGTTRARTFVPRAALRQDEGRDVVFVVTGERAERRAVTAGAASADEVEVLAGLAGGEQVVVEGPAGLSDGARVRVR